MDTCNSWKTTAQFLFVNTYTTWIQLRAEYESWKTDGVDRTGCVAMAYPGNIFLWDECKRTNVPSDIQWGYCANTWPAFRTSAAGVFGRLWWAQDGTLAQRLIAVRTRLRELFAERVTSWPWTIMLNDLQDPQTWLLVIFSLGVFKGEGVFHPPHDIADLRDRIEHEVNVLRLDPAMVEEHSAKRWELAVLRKEGDTLRVSEHKSGLIEIGSQSLKILSLGPRVVHIMSAWWA